MQDFNLVLRELINRDVEKEPVEIPFSLVEKFEQTADNFFEKDFILEAIKAFALTKNKNKLIQIGNNCISRDKKEFAFQAFYFAKDVQGLDKVGNEFLKNGEVEKALMSFKLADNKEMVEFIESNF